MSVPEPAFLVLPGDDSSLYQIAHGADAWAWLEWKNGGQRLWMNVI
jgi:hypothetical protein